jgi:aminodeoxyfutalosine deaminase
MPIVDEAVHRALAGLPKCELHVHLEGSLRPPTLARLATRNGFSPDELGFAVEAFSFRDFDHFIELFSAGVSMLRSPEDLVDAIAALAADLAAAKVRHAEVTTTAFAHVVMGGIPARAYGEALGEGRRVARRDHGVGLAWIVDIPRGFEAPGEPFTADLLTGPDAPEGVVAIGLGGPEIGFPAGWYADSFDRARAAGLHCVPHAGETGGAAYVTDALTALRAERIGHGVMCLEDDDVVNRLVETGVPLEVSLTSNVLLGVAASHDEHPLPALLERGLAVSLNTDDPGYFDTDLTKELELAHAHHGVDLEALRALQLGAVDASFLEPADKRALRAEIEAWAPQVSM